MATSAGLDRPDIYVLSRILERLWRAQSPMLKTRLQVATNMNYDLLLRYLGWMAARGFVRFEISDGHDMVCLTQDGRETYQKIVEVVNEVLRGG